MILQRQQSTPSSRPFSWGHANTAIRLNDKWSFLTLGVQSVKPYMATTRLDVSALARTPPIKHPCWEGSLCPDPGCGAKKLGLSISPIFHPFTEHVGRWWWVAGGQNSPRYPRAPMSTADSRSFLTKLRLAT